jgi:hypothetical protein
MGEVTAGIMLKGIVVKVDEDRRLVFGWASEVEKAGEAVVDTQDEVIEPDELEKAVYDFVLDARAMGDMHERVGVGRLVESMVFTTEKQKALGIDLGKVGWWLGFKVDDEGVWKRIKEGEIKAFSIGGTARRADIPERLAA